MLVREEQTNYLIMDVALYHGHDGVDKFLKFNDFLPFFEECQ